MKKERGVEGFGLLAVVILLYIVVYNIHMAQYRKEAEESDRLRITEIASYTSTFAVVTQESVVQTALTQESEWKWQYVLVPNPFYDNPECMTYRLAPWFWFPLGNARCEESTILEWRKVQK